MGGWNRRRHCRPLAAGTSTAVAGGVRRMPRGPPARFLVDLVLTGSPTHRDRVGAARELPALRFADAVAIRARTVVLGFRASTSCQLDAGAPARGRVAPSGISACTRPRSPGFAQPGNPPLVKPRRLGGHGAHRAEAVRYQHDRRPSPHRSAIFLPAFSENPASPADRALVDQRHLRVEVRCDREPRRDRMPEE